MVAFTRFSFLMRRIFFRLMHQDLNAILDGLRELEQRGVETLDCRRAQFSAEEPIARLRMICQSWKVMFHAEYSSGQPVSMLVDLAGRGGSRFGKECQASGSRNAGRPGESSRSREQQATRTPRTLKSPAIPAGARTLGSRTTKAIRSSSLTPDFRETQKGNVDQPSVLIISDDAEFSRAVTARWQSERAVPAFTLMSSDVCLGLDPDTFQSSHRGLSSAPGALGCSRVHGSRGQARTIRLRR